MDEPVIHKPHPSLFPLTILGGMVATVLLMALTHLGPVWDLPLIDMPLLVGGVFSADPDTAFRTGHAVFILAGIFVFALSLSIVWAQLPGDDTRFPGATLKGLVWGLFLWVLSGLVLPLLGGLNQLPLTENPGLFALEHGVLGPIWLLVLQLSYGLVLTTVAGLGHGLQPIDTIGWMWTSHGSGEAP